MSLLDGIVDRAKSAVQGGVRGASELANNVWSILPKPVKQRAVESAFRADRDANVVRTIAMFNDEDLGRNRAAKYILTGNDKGDKRNRSVLAPNEEIDGDQMPWRANNTYTGMWVNHNQMESFNPNMYKNDLIDGIIYNKPVDLSIGRPLTEQEKLENPYKSANQYIVTEPKNVKTYSQENIQPITMNNGHKYSGAHGNFMTASGYPIDNAGTVNQYGIRNDSVFVRGFDNWGINRDDSRAYASQNQTSEQASASDQLMNKVKGIVGSVSTQTPWVYIGDAQDYGIHQGSIEMLKQYGNKGSGENNYFRLLNWIKNSGSEISPVQYNTRLKRTTEDQEGLEMFKSEFPEITDETIGSYVKDYKKRIHKSGGKLNYLDYFK